ncbi:MAG: energy transducer TonB [Bacteroidetes bacterium]|nr:energy transducer TonB [Bacteroidota bacterium]
MEILKADLDDILFRFKNRSYGSYDLRKRSARTLLVAFALGVLLVGTLLALPVIINVIKGQAEAEETFQATETTLMDAPPVDNEEELPEEIKQEPPPPPTREEIKFTPPEIVEDDKAPEETTIKSTEELLDKDADIGKKDVEGDPNADRMPERIPDNVGNGSGDKVPVPVKEPDPNAFVAVERQPVAVNMDDIKKRIKYPEVAREMGLEGKVMLRIMIDEEGNPKKHLVLRSPHPSFTDAAVKEIYNLKFTPAIQGGKPIVFWATVPIDFSLKKR